MKTRDALEREMALIAGLLAAAAAGRYQAIGSILEKNRERLRTACAAYLALVETTTRETQQDLEPVVLPGDPDAAR